MKENKNTKKALFGSILTMIVCVGLLVGSTFAWFTDSVTSEANRIVAGNLGVDLIMDKEGNGKYVSVAGGEGDIFSEEGNGAHWEPGKTEIVYLGVQNKGSLALNYNILLDVTDGNPGLVGALEYAVLDGKKAADLKNVTSWEELKKITGAQTGDIVAGTTVAAPNGTLDEIAYTQLANETDYFALAVHMKETADNTYQNGSITIDVNVVAKQAQAETDSFGNDYDAEAKYDIVSTEQELKDAFKAGGSYKLGKDIQFEPTILSQLTVPNGVEVTLDLNGKTLESTSTKDRMYVITNRGTLTINGDGIIKGNGGINSTAGKLIINGGTFNCSSNYANGTNQHTLKATNSEVVINGGTFDATVGGQKNALIGVANNATVTINGGNFKNVHELGRFDPYLFTYEGNGKLIINDGTFFGGWRFSGTGKQASTDIYGGTFSVSYDGQSFQSGNDHVLTVYGGTFNHACALTDIIENHIAEGYEVQTNESGDKIIIKS